MGPKVEAALRFLDQGGTSAVITSLPNLNSALAGDAGARIATVAPTGHQTQE